MSYVSYTTYKTYKTYSTYSTYSTYIYRLFIVRSNTLFPEKFLYCVRTFLPANVLMIKIFSYLQHFLLFLQAKSMNSIAMSSGVITDLSPVGMADIPMLKEFFKTYPSRSCDFSLGGVLMWRDYFDYHYAVAADSLFIIGKAPDSDTAIFYEPRGPLSLQQYEKMIRDYCNRRHIDGRMMITVENTPEAPATATVEQPLVDDWREYLYDISHFEHFAGKKMEKKRNHLNFFNSHYPNAKIEEIEEKDIPELIAFTEEFNLRHDGSKLLHYENMATKGALASYFVYGFTGIVIRIDGKVAGFTFGEPNGDTFFVHVEKGDIEYRGIYQALSSAMARLVRKLLPEVAYLNREDDMGFEALKSSKMSYHPILFIDKRLL